MWGGKTRLHNAKLVASVLRGRVISHDWRQGFNRHGTYLFDKKERPANLLRNTRTNRDSTDHTVR